MGSHPINLTVRFLLELIVLVVAGMWGWKQTDSWLKFVLVISVPLLLATVWGVFNVPDDPSRSGNAPLIVPGLVRLLIELAFFGFGVWALYQMGYHQWSTVLAIVVLIHYLVSYDRIGWLLGR